MAELERLRPDHGPAVLAFERENRAYFAASVTDRGDDYFAQFDALHRARLAEQEAGVCAFHVLLDEEGAVVGRINLVDISAGSAELGFRIAERAAGRGLATAAVRRVCVLAATDYGLSTLRAAAALDNVGSRTVLERAGFVAGAAATLPGRPGTWYERSVSAPPANSERPH